MAKGRKTGGRKPGTPNKLTADVKSPSVAAFNEVGGSAYLVRLAEDNPAVFCSLLGKVVPAEKHIEANVGQSLSGLQLRQPVSVRCQSCGHVAPLAAVRLRVKLSPDAFVKDFGPQFRCQRCLERGGGCTEGAGY
jgi:hypothetical protein